MSLIFPYFQNFEFLSKALHTSTNLLISNYLLNKPILQPHNMLVHDLLF